MCKTANVCCVIDFEIICKCCICNSLRFLQVAKKEKINYDSLNLSFLKFKVFSVTVFLTPAGSEHGMTKLHLVYSK